MTDIAKLNIEINSQKAKQAKTDLDQLTRSGQQAEKGMGSLSAAAKRLGVALAAAFSAYAVVNETRKMIQAASDLEETMNKFNVVFRGLETQANTWAKNLQENFAMSRNESYKYLASIQDLLVPMGIARDTAGQLANKIVQLSADLGSFNNLPTVKVMEDIQSSLVGNYETMRKYGVLLSAAIVEQEALNLGLAKTKDELTAADKAQAAYNLMVKNSADAIGDMARSSDSYENQMKKLQANIDDFRTSVGTQLLPIATAYVSKLNEWVRTNETLLSQDLPEYARKIADDLLKIVDALSDIKVIYDALPSDVVGPGSSGLVGYLLFGKTGAVLGLAANLVPAIANIIRAIDQINKGNMSVGEFAGMNAEELEKFLDDLEKKSRKVYYAIDENTEGFELYSKAAGKAEVATGDLAGATSNLAGNANKLTEAMKKAMAEQAVWEHEASIKAIQYAEEARQEYWQESIEIMNEMVAREKEAWEKLQDEKADAAKKALEEQSRAEEEARREYEREWERVYDDMHEFAADTFYDIFDGQLDSFEDFADSMLDVFRRMLANMAAEAAMTNIFKPMMNQMAGSALGSVFGLPSLYGPGSSGVGALTMLPGMGWLGATIPGTAILGSELGWGASAARNIGVMASPGVTWGSALGAGALGGLGYSTLGSAIGLPTSEYSGLTAGLGAAGMSAYGGSLAGLTGIGALGGPIGIGLGALVGGLLGGLFGGGSDPKPALGIQGGLSSDPGRRPTDFYDSRFFNWTVFEQDLSADAAIAIRDYFDNYFLQIDTAVNGALKETFNKYDAGAVNSGWVYTEGLDEGQIINGISDTIFKGILEGLKAESLGAGFEAFDVGFFESLKTEGQDLFGAYADFYNVVSNTEGFIEDFTRRIDELGQTSLEAYQQIQLVSGVLAEMDMVIAQITGSAVIGQINALANTWNAYIDVMRQARATAEQLAEAEQKKNLVIGAQITGLTATSVEQALMSGGDISRIVEQSMKALMVSVFAENLMESALKDFNKQVGQAFAQGGADAAFAVYEAFDFGPIEIGINEFLSKFENGIDNLSDVAANEMKEINKFSESVDDARGVYKRFIQDALSDAQSKQEDLVQNFKDAEEQLARVREEHNQKRLAETKERLSTESQMYAETARDLENRMRDFQRLSEQMQDYQFGLITGSDSPLLPGEMLDAAKSQFASAGPEQLIEASQNLLRAGRAALTDPAQYEALFEQVQSRVGSGISSADAQAKALQEQIDMAEIQVELLQAEIDVLTKSDDTLTSLSDANAEYQQAKMELDTSQYADQIDFFGKELSRLETIDGSVMNLAQATENYQMALVAAIGSGYRDLETRFAMELQTLRENISAMATTYPQASFAGGGIISGPESGYTVLTEFHGTERITTANGEVIDKEVKDLLRALISEVQEDRNLSKKIHRVLDRVTAGANSFQTRAEDA